MPHSLTLDEWKKRETALLAHVHSIAERYRRELFGLTVYINRSLKTFEQLKMTLATLLCCLTEREKPATDIEAWVLEINSGEDTLRCRCQEMLRKSIGNAPVNERIKDGKGQSHRYVASVDAFLRKP